MSDEYIINYQKDEEEYLLKDIAFEMRQIAQLKELVNGIHFSRAGKNINKAIRNAKERKERLINDYTIKYGRNADIETAKRLFLEDQRANGTAREDTGVLNNVNPELE